MNTITLDALRDVLSHHHIQAALVGDGATPVWGAACDSRLTEPRNLFVCKGAAFKPAFLKAALDAGAVAYLCAPEAEAALIQIAPGIPHLVTEDLRRAMAYVSAAAWGNPDQDLTIIGVTGTKGKTTVTCLMRAMLDSLLPKPCAFLGTHIVFDGLGSYESSNTTPEAPELWRYLARAKQAGLTHVVMEVSSQALKYDRTLGLRLSVGCFLNIGNDHVSPVEHPSFEDYFSSKLRIFAQSARCVYNLDTDFLTEVACAASASALSQGAPLPLTYSLENPQATVFGGAIEPAPGGMSFVAHTPQWQASCFLDMLGTHNVEDAVAALACLEAADIDDPAGLKALASAYVPGRMEVLISPGAPITTIVDYAHNDVSYHRFFDTVHEFFPEAYLIALFGVSGGKALNRYKDLPTIASQEADRLILTSDDPGPINPAALVDEISAYVAPDVPYDKEPDRTRARELAWQRAQEHVAATGQPVVICSLGKANEASIYQGGQAIPIVPDPAAFRALMGLPPRP